jgi:AcrR family transcriptional regulator
MARVSPKVADPAVRTALLESAARLIATEGPAGLTLRRLADEVGTSTMAVYTHFGGMQNLRQEVRREGFSRLRAHLAAVRPTADPLADLARQGWAYHDNALENPNLYRAMFMDPEPAGSGIGLDTFEQLVSGVRRCLEAGRFSPADPHTLALQLWSAAHGVIALQLCGLLDAEVAAATLGATWRNLCLAFGDDPEATARSMTRAQRTAR